MSSSNQSRFLANKPRNKVNVQRDNIFRIDGNITFVVNYGRWSEKHKRLVCEIPSALNDKVVVVVDDKLVVFLIDTVMKHYFEVLEMKTSAAAAANSDAFSSVASASERNLWWIGGFRPSQLLQVILPQVQHLCSQQQLCDIYKFVESCQQAEDALAQGMEKLHQILHNATAHDKLTFVVPQQITFLKQADHVREQFLYQLSRLLTICQYAEFLLAFGERLYNPQPWTSL